MDLVGLLLNLIILLLILTIFYLIVQLILRVTGLPLDMRIVQIIFLVIVLLWFVGFLAGSIPAWRPFR